MATEYISLIETGSREPRTSSLAIFEPNALNICVIGILPHGYTFRPKTTADRDALVSYLQNMEFKS